jgi:hypothetical protein
MSLEEVNKDMTVKKFDIPVQGLSTGLHLNIHLQGQYSLGEFLQTDQGIEEQLTRQILLVLDKYFSQINTCHQTHSHGDQLWRYQQCQ